VTAVSRLPFAPPALEIEVRGSGQTDSWPFAGYFGHGRRPLLRNSRLPRSMGQLAFVTRPGRAFDRAKLRRAIEDLGFTVHKITVAPSAATGDGLAAVNGGS